MLYTSAGDERSLVCGRGSRPVFDLPNLMTAIVQFINNSLRLDNSLKLGCWEQRFARLSNYLQLVDSPHTLLSWFPRAFLMPVFL